MGGLMSKRVILAFVEEDLLFRGQATNKKSDLEFDDYSVKVRYNSMNADYIRSYITSKIRAASATIVIIGARPLRAAGSSGKLKRAWPWGTR